MKKIIAAFAIILLASCEQKEAPKSQYQEPIASPYQMQDDTKLIREIVQKDPGNVTAWIKLGNALMDLSRFNEAIDAYGKALDLDPKNADVRVDMGICYRNSNRSDIAAQEFRKALEINPRHLNGRKNLAVVLAYDLNDKAGALKEFEQYLKVAPDSPDSEQVKQEIQSLKTPKTP